MTKTKDMGEEELKLRLQRLVGTIIISLGHLGPKRALGSRLRTVPGLFFTNKPSLSRQEESTKHFNFSTSDEKSRKEAEHRYPGRGQGIFMSEYSFSTHGAANIGGWWRKMGKNQGLEPGKKWDLGIL